jgi:phospholipase/carboxylesterase
MEAQRLQVAGPHAGAVLSVVGKSLDQASTAVILLHGRGAGADDMLLLADELNAPDAAWLAPEAVEREWYPHRFLVPSEANQPWLDSALAVVDGCVAAAEAAGIPTGRIFLIGFSQGACLALEWAARSGRKLGGLFGLSGGLIGSGEEVEAHSGNLENMPVFLGCSDIDPHIPKERVEQSARVLTRLGADVTVRLYAGMGHSVNLNELEFIQSIIG